MPWLSDDGTRDSARELFEWFTDGERISDVEGVVSRASYLIGMPIRIEPVGSSDWDKLTGLTISHPDHYSVLIRPEDSTHYQVYCLLHEISHLLYGHPPSESVTSIVLDDELVEVRHARLIVWDGHSLSATERRYEGEAEELARLLGTLVMHPRYLSGEDAWAR